MLDAPESTLLDLLDNLLNKGVMANGDVTLGVAGVDLIYLRLSALLRRGRSRAAGATIGGRPARGGRTRRGETAATNAAQREDAPVKRPTAGEAARAAAAQRSATPHAPATPAKSG